jgi:predicted RND superfamily exporter protein
MSELKPQTLLARVYRFRWALTCVSLLCLVLVFRSGIQRVKGFTTQVNSLSDTPPEKSDLRMFDPRNDIWFDSQDPALRTYHEIEARFVGQDTVLIGLTEPNEPDGVFSLKSLQAIDRLSKKLKKLAYVRTVRSLVANPWIRWEDVDGETGLIISDLFEEPPETYSELERSERLVSVLGAKNAIELIGTERVLAIIGKDAKLEDHIGEPRILQNLLNPDGRSTAIAVQLLRPRFSEEKLDETFGAGTLARNVGPAIHSSAVQFEALHAIRALLKAEEAYEFHVTGGPVMREHYMQVAKHDMSFIGLMFVVIAIVLFILYRSVSGVLLPLAIVFLAIMGMLGSILFKGDLINLMTAITPHMLIAIGVASSIHLLTAYVRLRPTHDNKHELVLATLRFNMLPVFLTSLTTIVGFLSLTTSGIVPIKQFGYSTAIGTLIAFVLSMIVVPTFLSLIPLKKESKKESPPSEKAHWSEPLARFVFKRRLSIVLVGAILIVIGGAGFYTVNLTTELRTMFGKDNPVVGDIFWIDDHVSGTGDLDMLFKGAMSSDTQLEASKRLERIAELGTPTTDEYRAELASLKTANEEYARGQIADSPEFLTLLDKFQMRLESEARKPDSPLHIVTSIDSALGVLRKMHQVQNQNLSSFYRVPVDADIPAIARAPRVYFDEVMEEEIVIPGQNASTMIGQYYLQFENGAKPEENLSEFITPDRRMFRFTMRSRSVGSVGSLKAYARIREIVETEFPQLAASVEDVEAGKAISSMEMTGNTFLQAHMITAFSRTLITSLGLAFLVITIIISLVFRSLRIGLVSMIPNILPIMLPLGFLSLLGTPMDGPAMVVAAVGLGICVDDTIHFLTKYTRAQASGLGHEAAIQKTFKEIGGALTYTSFVLGFAFAMMMFATFRANVMIGALGAIIIALAWAADLILTPAILSFLPHNKQRAHRTKEPRK